MGDVLRERGIANCILPSASRRAPCEQGGAFHGRVPCEVWEMSCGSEASIEKGVIMEFRRIEYFLVLADKLNYAKAAKELCISSQALTKQINILEDELGTKLFERTTRSVALTEDGEMCRNQFANLKAHYDETLRAVKSAVSDKHALIRIGIFAALPKNNLLNPIMQDLTNEFPDIDFDITTNNMDGLRDDVKNGMIDLAITNAHDFEDWQGCDRINFAVFPAQIVVSEKHSWVKDKKKKISSKDMEDADILLMIKHGPYEFNSFYQKVKTKKRNMSPDFDSMMMRLETGKEFAVFPRAFNDMENSKFVYYALPDEYKFNYRTMCACNKSNPNPAVKKVFKFIKENKTNYSLF